jgi:aspartyl-tRNA(Asn)/glutamyl-tRNA(Gln) amidotransferase subunit C
VRAAVPIDKEQVSHIASLAHLDLDPDDVERFRHQLQAILDHMEVLAELDVGEVVPTAHPLGRGQALRPDEATPSLPREEALANAPDAAVGQFRVPRVLKG